MGPSADKSSAGAGGEKKIFVQSDESWKADAQKEKERLQKKIEEETEEKTMPPPSFLGLVSDIGVQAMLALGLLRVEGGGEPKRDLPSARYAIDLLGVLEAKTQNNLTAEEKAHLGELLSNLRMGYVNIAKTEEGKK